MSSVRISIGRKRHHDSSLRDSSSNNSSDSEEHEFYRRPKKKRTKFPNFIASHLKNIRLWIADLPVSPFFDMALKSSVDLFDNKSIMKDDDDEVQIIGVKNVDKSEKKDRPNPFLERLRNPRRRNVDYSEKDYYTLKAKLNGATADDCLPSSDQASTYEAPSSNSLFCADILDMTHHDWDPDIAEVHPLYKPPEVKPRPTTSVSSPETDIEILLETNRKKPDPDEIEILSESPIQKNASLRSVRISSRPPLRSSTPSCSSALARTSIRSQPGSSRSYTAHEVVRLQEKAQYKLLLEKYISGSPYHPIAKRPQKDAETQVDVPMNPFESSYEKAALQQPVRSFVRKYLKPCHFSPITDSSRQSSEKAESKEAKCEDDEIQILEVKMPKYKYKCKEKADLLSTSWIAELKSAVSSQTEERLRIVEEQERELENLRRERILERLRVTLPEPVEDEFPDLTPEMEEIVDKALTTGDPNDRMCKITSDYLLRKDIETLAGLNWINDLVINSYFDLIVERSKEEGYPSVHAYNTFFYTTYKQKGYASVRRWTRKLDIFSYDLNFVPIHLGVHWCLAVIDHRSKKICYYDSMGSGEEHCLDLLHEYLLLEYKDKKGKILDSNVYTTEVKKNIPQQMNGSDCGMFTLKYAEYISRDAVITFSQKHMHYFRRRMVYELITTQLL